MICVLCRETEKGEVTKGEKDEGGRPKGDSEEEGKEVGV